MPYTANLYHVGYLCYFMGEAYTPNMSTVPTFLRQETRTMIMLIMGAFTNLSSTYSILTQLQRVQILYIL